MITTIHSGTYVARKRYNDDGYDMMHSWLRDSDCYVHGKEVDPEDRLTLELHMCRSDPWNIRRGDQYERQFNNYDGDLGVFRMNKHLYQIACKYDLFEDY